MSHKFNIITAVVLSLLLLFLGGCNKKEEEKIFTIGIAVHTAVHLPIVEGFNTGMTELGYVEGKNIRYIYSAVLGDNKETFDSEIRKLLSQDIDLLLTTGSDVSLSAKKILKDTDIQILFCASVDPKIYGLIENQRHPGGNITGIKVSHTSSKLMELLTQIRPGIKEVYMPYNPDDEILSVNITSLNETASQLGVNLVTMEVHSVEEAVRAIKSLPEDRGVIFRVPSPTLDDKNSELSREAIKRGIPMGSVLPLDESVLITFAPDFFSMGKQAARLANQIIHGIKTADLPVEVSGADLTINLKTAEKMGINIPNNILLQAKKIIR